MDREKLFKEFIKECGDKEQICGAGNHNSNILLVGNEHYSETTIKDWKEYLKCNYDYCANTKSWSNFNKSKTWLYYQKLIDAAIPDRLKPTVRGERNFEEDAFTTELNSEAKPSSRVKGKEREELRKRIQSRLDLFKQSDFIKSFPVVVLACGSYLTNNVEKGITQINDTFGVEFDNQLNIDGEPIGWHKSENGKLWFTTHHSKDKQKLVIHTWQFSLRCTKREDREWLIDKMASVIREHLKKLGLI